MLMFKMTEKKQYDDNNDNVSAMSSQKECCCTAYQQSCDAVKHKAVLKISHSP